MDDDLAEEVLNTLSAETSDAIRLMLKYLEHTVGSHIDLTALTLTDSMTVKEALEETKRYKKKIQPNLFVLSPNRKLVGVVNIQDLIREKPGREIQSIMNTNIAALHPETPIKSILTRREWNEFYSLPVVDKNSVFLGVIKLETVRSLLSSKGKVKEGSSEDAISALGELYHIGLAGLLNSATELRSKPQ
jgi:Mg/Co/Ni transporter MgtE